MISETVMTITFVVKDRTRGEERYSRAVWEYSVAVEALACVGDGSRTEALMRAHETHIEMLAVTNGCVLKAVPYVRRRPRPA